MDNEENLATLAGRLATFNRPHHFAKRRASSAKKKAQTTVSWPHETPTPQDLARAGFYYKPSSTSQDSVTCFLCDKVLDGWEAGDNPATEHLSHVPDCGFAINVCIEQRSQDMDRAEEDPQSEKMMESRRATFQDAWPHDGRKGWKCKTSKMVEAGWCYAPLPEADDCVHCFYCGVSLDGWEPKDDPWDEHRRRAPECHFFTLIEESTKLKQQAKKGKGRQSRASKAARLSTQSNMTTMVEPPTMIESDDEPAEEGDTMMTTLSTASKATKVRKNAGKKAAPKRTRKMQKRDESTIEKPAMEEPAEQEVPAEEMQVEQSIPSPVQQEVLPQPPKSRAKRQTKRTASQAVDMESGVMEVQPPARKASRTTKARKQTEIEEDVAQLHAEVDAVAQRLADASRPSRGKKRTSDGLEKVESSVMVVESVKEAPMEKPKTMRARPIKKTAEAIRDDGEVEPKQSEDFTFPTKGKAKGKANAKKGRVASQQQPSESSDEQDVYPPLETPQSHTQLPTEQRVAAVLEPSLQKAASTPNSKPTGRSPTTSPQSSDAENVPPSSRPSLSASQQAPQTIRVPLASTPEQSPSKRNILPAVSTVHPWNAVNLERIFLASPVSRTHKENINLENVLQSLTSGEKKMSVEQWILANAESAEARLKAECERLIWKFEGEGNRALRSLEGIEAA